MNAQRKFPLGQLLIEKNIITQEQLEVALEKQRETGELLGIVLLELGYVDEEMVFLPILAGQYGVDYINIKEMDIPREAIDKIPAQFASHYKVMPIDFSNDTLVLATSKPLDVHMLDEISLVVNSKINPVLGSEKDVMEAIRKYYGVGAATIEQMMGTVGTSTLTDDVKDIEEIESEASISNFLNQIFLEAYRDRATDIHIEPFEKSLQVRYRVDGVLYDAKVPQNIVHFKDSITSRIKILSNLNIAEKRKPQDGRFKIRVGDVEISLRVSFLPTPYGESVVLRILNSTRLFSFKELGLNEREQTLLEGLIKRPHGIIFLTGPTGSGKTTTLYSCLSSLNTEENKIITIEDPIEYQLKGITQIQINPAVGLTFAEGLRSMLRHDPDIMMVGEVRDLETADIAIQVALTGHLIFSTLHTNDAASGVTRLIDMGVAPYLITSTIECFIAQRLVRVVCSKCKEPSKITKEMIKDFEDFISEGEEMIIYQGPGCEHCNFTGYVGREPIYEFLPMNEEIRNLIMKNVTVSEIKEAAMRNGMTTLREAGWEKVKSGATNPQEVMRVTQEEGS